MNIGQLQLIKGKRDKGLRDLRTAFVALVLQIPEVQTVLMQRNGDSAYILTVIDAPPFERGPRDRVYQAQQAVLEKTVSRPVDFRVINSREIQVPLAEIVPPDCEVFYEKR